MSCSPILSRRQFLTAAATVTTLAGCNFTPDPQQGPTGTLELMWGKSGIGSGLFQKPRAMAIDKADRLFIVDMTARIQVFTRDGEYLYGWSTPESKNGRPTGLSFDREGNLLVADTHYFRMLVYTPEGKLLANRTIGGESGSQSGQFNFVTDCVQDSQGNYYIAEYGEFDRIQKFSREGKFLLQWGEHGAELGKFVRPQALLVDAQDHIWVADACNHRLQVFNVANDKAELIAHWGEHGNALGELHYPYGIEFDTAGHIYVCEFGNHRVQKFTTAGKLVGWWGTNGRRRGELDQPWTAQLDSQGSLHVLDTYNHRIQRIRL
jgi:NHL repeat